MDTSRRAVESYWRSRMIDAATSDEDKVAPVYKLEEICELLRSSSAGIVKEVSDFLLKRLDHKSPIVKQKALRLIKYSVGKSGTDFRREMQRHSVAVKQLLHYKGQPDPLKGDALNKAVRETAQDALSAIFSTDDNKNKSVATEVTHKRMEGFGNTNFTMPPEEKKSFLSEVVGLGSASLKQGLNNLAQVHSQSFKKNDTGSYRGPTLNRSLTNAPDHSDRYDKLGYHGGSHSSTSIQRNATSGPWGQDSRTFTTEAKSVDSSSSVGQSKTREERFLETIVTSGGVRLQPTRDALLAFLVEACKMDALALSRALESKLQSPNWQVRVKAVCVLEAIVRKRDDEHFATIASYFTEHIDLVIKCSESPQSSLREKANKVLGLLGGEQNGSAPEKPTKAEKTVIEMPDLIDTGDHDLLGEDNIDSQNEQVVASQQPSSSLLIDDLFGDVISSDVSKNELRTDNDPFADVSFHTSEDKDQGNDLFAGMAVGESSSTVEVPSSDVPDPFDVFGSSEPLQMKGNQTNDVNNLMAGLSINGNGSMTNEKANYSAAFSQPVFSGSDSNPGSQGLNGSVSSGFDPQKATTNANTMFPMGSIPYNISSGMFPGADSNPSSQGLNGSVSSDPQIPTTNANAMFPMGAIPYNIPPGMTYNQFYPAAPVNYGAMGGLLAQQQQFMAAAMANFQALGSLNSNNVACNNSAGTLGGNVSPLPDIFNAKVPTQASTVMTNTPKEETKAFDFITDHLTKARDPKRVT